MKKFTLLLYQLCLFAFVFTTVSSCVKHPDSPGYEYVDDMFRSQAIEAYIDYGLVGDKVNDTLKNTISGASSFSSYNLFLLTLLSWLNHL